MRYTGLLVAIATLSIGVSLAAEIETFDPASDLQNKENALEQSPLDEDEHELAKALSTLLANTQDYSDEQRFDNQDLQDLSDALADMQQDGDPNFEDAQALLNALSQDNEDVTMQDTSKQDKDLAMQALMSVLEEAQQQDESAEMEQDEDEQALINALAEAEKQDEDSTMQDNAALAKTQQEKETEAQRALIMALAEAEDGPDDQSDEDTNALMELLGAEQTAQLQNKNQELVKKVTSMQPKAKAQWRRWRWRRRRRRVVRRVRYRRYRYRYRRYRYRRYRYRRVVRRVRRVVKRVIRRVRPRVVVRRTVRKVTRFVRRAIRRVRPRVLIRKVVRKLKSKAKSGLLKKVLGKAGKVFKLFKSPKKLGSTALSWVKKLLGSGKGGKWLSRITDNPRGFLRRVTVIIKKFGRKG